MLPPESPSSIAHPTFFSSSCIPVSLSFILPNKAKVLPCFHILDVVPSLLTSLICVPPFVAVVLQRVVVFQSGYMFGAPGAGGQMGYSDPSHSLGIGFLTNYRSIFAIGDDPRYLELERAIYTCAKE